MNKASWEESKNNLRFGTKGVGDLYLKMSIWDIETHQEKASNTTRWNVSVFLTCPASPPSSRSVRTSEASATLRLCPAPPPASFLTGSQTPLRDTPLAEPPPSVSWGGAAVALLWTQKTSLQSFRGSMRVICQPKEAAENGLSLDWGPGVQPCLLG